MWRPVADPKFSELVRQLSRRVGLTVSEIRRVLRVINIETLTPDEQRRLIREVNGLLNALDANMVEWVDKTVDSTYIEGRARVLVNLGIVASIPQAVEILRSERVSRVHRAFLNGLKEVTTDDLLRATANTRGQVKSAIRRAYAEALREGITDDMGRRAISADAIQRIRGELGGAANFAIRDRLNRVWTLEHYVEVVTQTKLVEAHVEGVRNEALERGAYYGVVSSHMTACSKCIPWEGRILKLTPDAPGNYPTVEDARSGGLWHPRCEHGMNVVRDPSLLPRSVREKDDNQR